MVHGIQNEMLDEMSAYTLLTTKRQLRGFCSRYNWCSSVVYLLYPINQVGFFYLRIFKKLTIRGI